MTEQVHSPSPVAEAEPGSRAARRARAALALELVAMRGKDVVGVRHLREGGTAWVGNVGDALARVPARDLGGYPFLIGEVRGGTFVLHLPARARARLHGGDGIPRLLIGPHRLELREGDRAVLVLGAVQIRAQPVAFDARPDRLRTGAAVGAWLLAIAVVYAAALAVSAALTPAAPPRLDAGTMERLHERFVGAGRDVR
jgi:hypothetical protein